MNLCFQSLQTITSVFSDSDEHNKYDYFIIYVSTSIIKRRAYGYLTWLSVRYLAIGDHMENLSII